MIFKNNGEDEYVESQEYFDAPEEVDVMQEEIAPVEEVSAVEEDVLLNIKYYEINDPDGYSNLRDSPGGKILRRVYLGEKFEVFGERERHKKVKLSSGEIGYIHVTRVVESIRQ